MKKNTHLLLASIALITVLMLGVGNAPRPAVAQATVGATPGTLVKYQVDSFYVNFDALTGEPGLISYTGDLAGSILYAKVINVGNEEVTFWDPSTNSYVTTSDPIVDLAAGLILKNAITFNVNGSTVTLPAGAGYPVPFIFGSVTRFNVSSWEGMGILPLPLYLNSEWDTHEATVDLADGVSAVRTTSEFIISVNMQGGDTLFDGDLTWRLSDGLFTQAAFSITNTTDSTTYIDFKVSLLDTQIITVDLLAGTNATLSVDVASAQYSATGDAAGPDTDEAFANFTAMQGKDVFKLQILETQGMYYKARTWAYDEPTDALVLEGDYWYHSFGIYPFGPLTAMDAMPFSDSPGMVPREGTFLGPFSSPDIEIYEAWMTAFSNLDAQDVIDFFEIIDQEADNPWGTTDIGNSQGGDQMLLTLTPTYNINATHMEMKLDISFDLYVNETSIWETWNGTNYENVTHTHLNTWKGDVSFSIVYALDDPMRFQYFDITGSNLVFNFTEIEDGVILQNGQVEISSFQWQLGASYEFPQPSTPTNTTTPGNATTTGGGPLSLPGPSATMAVAGTLTLGLAVIYRRKRSA